MPSSAKEKVVALSKRFIFEYENALVTLKLPSFPYVERGDNTALFLERLRYKIVVLRFLMRLPLETNMKIIFLRGCQQIVRILFRNVYGQDMVELKAVRLQIRNH